VNLQQLVTFTTVISEGSMTAAAEKLYLTQPAVSQQIRNLEEETGVELLVRGTRQARATIQGQLLYEYAKKIIALTQQAQVAIQTIGEGVQGSLRIGTLNSLGLYLLGPLVGTFLRHNAKINMALMYEDGVSIFKALEKGELDAAILPEIEAEYGIKPTGLEVRELMKDDVWLVASNKEMGLPQSISVKDLNLKPFVRFSEKNSNFNEKLRLELVRQNIKLKPVFESNNVGTVKKVIESGLGWGFLPSHSIKKQVRAGRLLNVEVTDLKYSININYYLRKTEQNSHASEIFYRALKQPTLS
jgi:DNA-binding transcriptional LysR family regulator